MTAQRIGFSLLVVAAVSCAPTADSSNTDTTMTITESTTSSTAPPTTATTAAPLQNVFLAARAYLRTAISDEVTEFIDAKLAEAGVDIDYTVTVDMEADPVTSISVASSADLQTFQDVAGQVTLGDGLAFTLIGGGPAPTLEGDETYASLNLPDGFLASARFIEGLSALLDELGLPASTLARIEGTRAVDGTQVVETESITGRWTYHPDDGLNLILERTP